MYLSITLTSISSSLRLFSHMYVCMYVCVHVCMYVHARMYVCTHLDIDIPTYIHAYIHTYMQYIHKVHTSIHTDRHPSIHPPTRPPTQPSIIRACKHSYIVPLSCSLMLNTGRNSRSRRVSLERANTRTNGPWPDLADSRNVVDLETTLPHAVVKAAVHLTVSCRTNLTFSFDFR